MSQADAGGGGAARRKSGGGGAGAARAAPPPGGPRERLVPSPQPPGKLLGPARGLHGARWLRPWVSRVRDSGLSSLGKERQCSLRVRVAAPRLRLNRAARAQVRAARPLPRGFCAGPAGPANLPETRRAAVRGSLRPVVCCYFIPIKSFQNLFRNI